MDTDIIHPFGDHREWNESFYFNFYDRSNDICGFMRIGLKPNKNEKSVFCFFMMPDGGVYGFKGLQPYGGDALSVNGLTFTKAVPEKQWGLTFTGMMAKMATPPSPVKAAFSLDFNSLNHMFDYRESVSGEKELISKSVASEHLEQYGRITGKLTLGEKEYLIDGLGERDHSWGIREWNAPKTWIWLTCQFNENAALNVTKLAVDAGIVDAGFINVNGVNLPIAETTIDTRFTPDGGPGSFILVIIDKSGTRYEVNADILKQAILPFESTDTKSLSMMYETLARYTFNGMVGYGIAEYLIKKY